MAFLKYKKMPINSNIKLPVFKLIKVYPLLMTFSHYNKFINWVSGEFDLYLKEETNELKVYFPNGWFRIGNFITEDLQYNIELELIGNSKTSCEKVLKKVESTYNRIELIVQSNVNKE